MIGTAQRLGRRCGRGEVRIRSAIRSRPWLPPNCRCLAQATLIGGCCLPDHTAEGPRTRLVAADRRAVEGNHHTRNGRTRPAAGGRAAGGRSGRGEPAEAGESGRWTELLGGLNKEASVTSVCVCVHTHLGGRPVEQRLCQDSTSSPARATWGKTGPFPEVGVWAKSTYVSHHCHDNHKLPAFAMRCALLLHLRGVLRC